MRKPLKSPAHIILVGPMGAGKSSIGRLLAGTLQRAFVDVDADIEAEARAPITAIFATEGEAGFRLRESRALMNVLIKTDASVIATGGGAVLSEANRCAMRDGGTVVYLQVEPGMQLQRLQGDGTRPLLATADPAQRLAELQTLRDPLYRDVADMDFDTTQLSPEDVAAALCALLEQATEHSA